MQDEDSVFRKAKTTSYTETGETQTMIYANFDGAKFGLNYNLQS